MAFLNATYLHIFITFNTFHAILLINKYTSSAAVCVWKFLFRTKFHLFIIYRGAKINRGTKVQRAIQFKGRGQRDEQTAGQNKSKLCY